MPILRGRKEHGFKHINSVLRFIPIVKSVGFFFNKWMETELHPTQVQKTPLYRSHSIRHLKHILDAKAEMKYPPSGWHCVLSYKSQWTDGLGKSAFNWDTHRRCTGDSHMWQIAHFPSSHLSSKSLRCYSWIIGLAFCLFLDVFNPRHKVDQCQLRNMARICLFLQFK